MRVRLAKEIDALEAKISTLDIDAEQIKERMKERWEDAEDITEVSGPRRFPHESRREYLIRTGKITPFSKIGDYKPEGGPVANIQAALFDAEDEREEEMTLTNPEKQNEPSHRHLLIPGFDYDEEEKAVLSTPARSKKKRKTDISGSLFEKDKASDDEYFDSSGENSDDLSSDKDPSSLPIRKRKYNTQVAERIEDLTGVDDGNEKIYKARLRDWIQRRSVTRNRVQGDLLGNTASDNGSFVVEEPEGQNATAEWYLPHPRIPDTVLDGNLRIPGDIYPYLFDYQKTGVQWLWELHQQRVGGIIGDEMGLGKTIQVITFLASLHHSNKLSGPVIVVCPPTVMKQWVNEFHTWWAPFRVSILHTSGSGMVNIKNETDEEDKIFSWDWDVGRHQGNPKAYQAAKAIVKRVIEQGHILVTTYAGLQSYASLVIPVDWACAVLDEGHKIRNPDTSITIHCKELRTAHRIILSGTPMQNNLIELWSLFDFIFPMRLGTLINFRNQFEIPIRQGGYANASNLQVQIATKCAETLKDAISPYLLQRFKIDVAADLPKKSEQVLFCKLTKYQTKAYKGFLESSDMTKIMNGKREVLFGVDILRKICNHPDLVNHRALSANLDYDYGSGDKSGKMQVVKALLELWKRTGHKTLLFAQHRIMLDILQRFIESLSGFNYRRMDGNTPVRVRQTVVDEFNNNPDIHVFLLTTKVGGLGVNLTGADRVIIYDPDWNPSTDLQARERAWRLGQKREVTIYRLMTAGTIEEKIYHRQIFKQFLTNKILKDPKQRRTFQMSDLHDLFSLGDDGPIETSKMFKDAEVNYSKEAADITNKTKKENEEVQNVVGVSSVEKFEGSIEGEADKTNKEDNSQKESSTSENRLMQGIFARSGVHAVMEHGQIVNGKRVIRADPKIIEAEAKKLASQAAKELDKAGEVARSIPIGTPTWTGQFGSAGRPDGDAGPGPIRPGFGGSSSTARRAGGPSSANILVNLAHRGRDNGTPIRSRTSRMNFNDRPQGKDFMVMIRDYLLTHGGSVYTQMLIDHFNRFCDSPRATAEFKEILRTIAVLEKTGRSRGKWVLRPQYAKK